MTHDILQTDIDLATRLRDDQRPDEEIILALAHRGVDPAKAAQLVDDLRNDRRASLQSAIPPEFTLGRRPRPRRTARETGQSPPTPPPQTASRREQRARPAGRRRNKSPAVWWVAVALVGLAIAVVALVLFRRHRDQANSERDQTPKAASAKVDRAPREWPPPAGAASQNVSFC